MKERAARASTTDTQAVWELLLEDQTLRSMSCRTLAKELNTISMKTAHRMKVTYDSLRLIGILSQTMPWMEAWSTYKNIKQTEKDQETHAPV